MHALICVTVRYFLVERREESALLKPSSSDGSPDVDMAAAGIVDLLIFLGFGRDVAASS